MAFRRSVRSVPRVSQCAGGFEPQDQDYIPNKQTKSKNDANVRSAQKVQQILFNEEYALICFQEFLTKNKM